MLVEIPVTITFDHHTPNVPGGTAMSKVFTMRYDTDPDRDVPAQWTVDFPPKPTSHWMTDAGGVLFTLLSPMADKAIADTAEARSKAA